MADNVAVTAGSGETIAADEISGAKYQRVKLIHGADGTNAGDVSTSNGLPTQVVSALPAGTNNIGDVDIASIAAGDNNIGNVDIASIAAGDNNIGNVDVVTVPSDPFGANSDAAATAGSTGSIQAKLRLITSQLDSIKTAVETLDNAVAGSEYQVDIVSSALPSGASTLTEQQSQTTHLSTIAGDTTAIETAVQIIDDWDESDRAKVNPIVGQAGVQGGSGAVSANTQRVVLATDVPLPSGTNGIGKLTANSGVDIGDVDVTSILPGTGATNLGKAEDAAHSSGDVGVMALGVRAATPTERSAGPTDGDYEPFATNEVGAVWATLTPSANGGLSIFRSIDIDETEEDVKTSAGTVYAYYFANTSSSARYLKFYNATAANVTVGSTTPVMTLYMPPTSAGHVGLPYGITFGTAITVAATTGVADADTGAPGANECLVMVFYK